MDASPCCEHPLLPKFDISFGTGLKIGFATVLVLLFALIGIGIYGMDRIEDHLRSIVSTSIVKAELANTMQTALRERAIGMHSIAVLEDPFAKDAEYIHFNNIGARFAEARHKLEAMPLSDVEKASLARLREVTAYTQPLVTAAVDQALLADTDEKRLAVSRRIRTDALANQRRVGAELDHLMAMQNAAIGRDAAAAKTAHDEGRRLLLSIGLLASTLGAIIAALAVLNATRQANRLQHQALFDNLTQLPNRVLFQDRLQQAILASRRGHQPFALLALDLNRFKEVNDTLGHQYGDVLLNQVAARLAETSRDSDTVARMGGDEFALLLPATDRAGGEVFAKKLIAVLDRPFELNGKAVEMSASIGVACFPEHGTDDQSLIRHADAAMYVAKRARSGFAIYDTKKSDEEDMDLTLRTELRRAIETDQLVLYFQPKISHQTRKVDGLEALVRWQHPTRGLVPPDRFIPLAEQTGLIRPLTTWVLEHAVAQCAQLQRLGMPLTMAVNLSTINLKDPALPEKISAALRAHELDAKWLELEITESAVMDDTMRTVQVLAELDALGTRISIDDYGTGYCSLSYFKRLPLDDIKIDKSFVMGMAQNHDDATIVRSTIEMGHELGLRVVAEGVENESTWERLSELGCDAAQGYYMSRPLAQADLLKWLCESPWGCKAVCAVDDSQS